MVIAIVEMIVVAGEMIAVAVGKSVVAVTIAIDVGIAMTVAAIVTEEMIVTDLDQVVIRFFFILTSPIWKKRFWDSWRHYDVIPRLMCNEQ